MCLTGWVQPELGEGALSVSKGHDFMSKGLDFMAMERPFSDISLCFQTNR